MQATKQKALSQWFSPRWAANEIAAFAEIKDSDIVLEPSCGDGALLEVISSQTFAFGVEIDKQMAEIARTRTGRLVIEGDFLEVDIPHQPTVLLGNPPFKTDLVVNFIRKGYQLLPDQGRLVFLLSTHILQTPEKVLQMIEGFGAEHWIVPRTLFNRAQRPLSLLRLVKGESYQQGLALYDQALVFKFFPRAVKTIANKGGRGVWKDVVEWALKEAGGTADTQTIYRLVQPRRPTQNEWWRDKIRQILQLHFHPVSRGRWTLKSEEAN